MKIQEVELQGTVPKPSIVFGGRIHKFVPLISNCVFALFNKKERKISDEILYQFIKLLSNDESLSEISSPGLIPKVLHFICLTKEPEFLPFYARMAVLSALHHNPDWKAFFHFTHEPIGAHWDAIKYHVKPCQIPNIAYFGIAPLVHFAHKADIIRLLALKHVGGAYLDLDTLTLRSFEPLRHNSFVMGVQPNLPGQPGGLCNAIVFGQRKAPFLDLWIKEYSAFRSKGPDWLWDFMSVKMPAILATKYPSMITVLKPEALFSPLWDTIEETLFKEPDSQPQKSLPNYAVHLWKNTIKTRIESIDETYVKLSNSYYARLARPALENEK